MARTLWEATRLLRGTALEGRAAASRLSSWAPPRAWRAVGSTHGRAAASTAWGPAATACWACMCSVGLFLACGGVHPSLKALLAAGRTYNPADCLQVRRMARILHSRRSAASGACHI